MSPSPKPSLLRGARTGTPPPQGHGQVCLLFPSPPGPSVLPRYVPLGEGTLWAAPERLLGFGAQKSETGLQPWSQNQMRRGQRQSATGRVTAACSPDTPRSPQENEQKAGQGPSEGENGRGQLTSPLGLGRGFGEEFRVKIRPLRCWRFWLPRPEKGSRN